MLDLELISHHYLVFLEEFFETLAALALWYAYRALGSTEATHTKLETHKRNFDSGTAKAGASLDAQTN